MKYFVVLIVVYLMTACSEPTSEHNRLDFKDEAVNSGVDFVYRSGMSSAFKMPEIMGGGVALIDSDLDGDLDLYFVQSGEIGQPDESHRSTLFINDGRGKFSSSDAGDATTNLGYGMGVAVADVNGDRLPDIFVSQLGQNKLLLNQGDNRYKDSSVAAGFVRKEWSTAAAFADFDLDGDFDLWVVNYIEWRESIEVECYQSMLGSRDYCAPTHYNRPAQDRLFVNDGQGRFRESTESAGIKGIKGNGLGSVVSDFNEDGLLDIFVANDTTPNHLWLNQGDGTFKEEANSWNCAVDLHGVARAGMGVAAFDLDDDSDQDLMVVNITTEPDYVFRNEGDYFIDVTASVGLNLTTQRYTRFGIVVADLNNDTWLDIYEANGAVARLASPTYGDLFAEPNTMYMGNPTGRFETPQLSEEIQTSRAAVSGDLNSDGFLDIVVVNRDAKPNLLMNRSDQGNWLILDLRDKNGLPAIGSKVSIKFGDRHISRMVTTSGSYLSSGDPKVHFGLGSYEKVERVSVEWLGGATIELGDTSANQVLRIDQT